MLTQLKKADEAKYNFIKFNKHWTIDDQVSTSNINSCTAELFVYIIHLRLELGMQFWAWYAKKHVYLWKIDISQI